MGIFLAIPLKRLTYVDPKLVKFVKVFINYQKEHTKFF